MKKNKIFLFNVLFAGLILILNACDCIKGEGPIESEYRDVTNFTAIDLDISADVFITQDTGYSVKIEAQRNILDIIKTKISGKTLEIDFEANCVINVDDIRIYISMPELSEIEIDGSGTVKGTNKFNVQDLKLSVEGSGDIILDIIANSIYSDIDGSGQIKLSGSTKKHKIKIEGTGDLKAYDLVAYESNIRLDGSGDCKVTVHDELDIVISGSGDVYYKGSPNIKTRVKGSGRVQKID